MGTKYNPKRDRHFDAVSEAGKSLGVTMRSPEILFRRASHDDLDQYTPEMLALTAAHALKELGRDENHRPIVSVESVDGIAPNGCLLYTSPSPRD